MPSAEGHGGSGGLRRGGRGMGDGGAGRMTRGGWGAGMEDAACGCRVRDLESGASRCRGVLLVLSQSDLFRIIMKVEPGRRMVRC